MTGESDTSASLGWRPALPVPADKGAWSYLAQLASDAAALVLEPDAAADPWRARAPSPGSVMRTPGTPAVAAAGAARPARPSPEHAPGRSEEAVRAAPLPLAPRASSASAATAARARPPSGARRGALAAAIATAITAVLVSVTPSLSTLLAATPRVLPDAVRAALLFGFALWRVLARRARARTPAVVRKCAPGRRMLWRLGRGIAEC